MRDCEALLWLRAAGKHGLEHEIQHVGTRRVLSV